METKNLNLCANCGKSKELAEMILTSNEEMWCVDCADEHAAKVEAMV